MQVLSQVITATSLDIPADFMNDTAFAIAVQELAKINSGRTPRFKVNCIIRSAAVVFRILGLATARQKKSKDASAGTDDFLPIFIYIVLNSQVPSLVANCKYIELFHCEHQLKGMAGYCLVNLQSSLAFILNVRPDNLNMDPEEFKRKLANATSMFEAGPDAIEA